MLDSVIAYVQSADPMAIYLFLFLIAEYIQKMPAFDSLSVRSYLTKIEPGIDINITVKAPSGEIVQTTVPFGPNFFWPKL